MENQKGKEQKEDLNLNIFSSLYIDYQNANQNERNRENPADIVEINQNQIRNKTIYNLKVNKNDDFNRIISDYLDEIKGKYTNLFNASINKLNKSYDEYKKNILKYLDIKKRDILRVFKEKEKSEILLKFVVKNIFNKINNLIEIYYNIVNSIEKNINLLNKFLNQKEVINSKNPLEFFFNYNYEDIINTSVISQFNFEQINTLNITKNNYYKNYLNYLNNEKKNRSDKSFIIKKNDINGIKNEIKILKENFISFKNLKVENIDSVDLVNILESLSTTQNNFNLSKIEIKNFDLARFIQEIKLNENRLNKIKELKLYKGRYLNPNILSKLFINKVYYLVSLSLEKVNLTNLGWQKLLNIFYENTKVMENLEYLSLAGNSISAINKLIKKVEDDEEEDPNKDKTFKSLKIFNLSKNEIYKFDMELCKVPQLKLLDLTSNTIPTGLIMELMIDHVKDKLVLFNDNIFITNNRENNNKYIEYINKKFPTLDWELKSLNLRFSYDIENQKKLEELNISPSVKISLIKLDLSYCGFSTEVVINFLKNNYGLFSLKNLKLKYNNIQSDIFEKLLNDEISLENLKILDLSQNEIFCKKIEENDFLIQFIKKYTNLEILKLKNSYFYPNWIANVSPDYNKDPKFSRLYLGLLNYLKSGNREFRFITEIDNHFYLEEKYRKIFDFK